MISGPGRIGHEFCGMSEQGMCETDAGTWIIGQRRRSSIRMPPRCGEAAKFRILLWTCCQAGNPVELPQNSSLCISALDHSLLFLAFLSCPGTVSLSECPSLLFCRKRGLCRTYLFQPPCPKSNTPFRLHSYPPIIAAATSARSIGGPTENHAHLFGAFSKVPLTENERYFDPSVAQIGYDGLC